MSTLTERAFDALQAAGLEARVPANAVGECKAPYLVVQDGGVQPTGKTTGRRMILIHALVPNNQPGKLPTLLANARMAMRAVPSLRITATGEETVDDDLKAIRASLTYTALCAR